MHRADARTGAAAVCDGTLQALGVCCRACRVPLRPPALDLPWEAPQPAPA